jgi:hypothetical protein
MLLNNGSGTMLPDGMSRIRFAMKSLESFNWPNPSYFTMTLSTPYRNKHQKFDEKQ